MYIWQYVSHKKVQRNGRTCNDGNKISEMGNYKFLWMIIFCVIPRRNVFYSNSVLFFFYCDNHHSFSRLILGSRLFLVDCISFNTDISHYRIFTFMLSNIVVIRSYLLLVSLKLFLIPRSAITYMDLRRICQWTYLIISL